MKIKQGEVYKVDLGFAGKVRYMVVVSRTDLEPPRALVLCAPITTKFRNSKYEISIGKLRFLREPSFVNLQGIVAVQWNDLIDKAGQLDSPSLNEIKECLRYTFDV